MQNLYYCNSFSHFFTRMNIALKKLKERKSGTEPCPHHATLVMILASMYSIVHTTALALLVDCDKLHQKPTE